MAENDGLTQVTELKGLQKTARECITDLIVQMTGSENISFDFYREWNGGWRVGVDVSGPISGHMDFILFHTPRGGLLAIPQRLPEVWRKRYGVAASDETLWTVDDTGYFVPFIAEES